MFLTVQLRKRVPTLYVFVHLYESYRRFKFRGGLEEEDFQNGGLPILSAVNS